MTAVQAAAGNSWAAAPVKRTDELAFSPDAAEPDDQGGLSLFGPDGFTFGDLVDMVNPLQHIPVISTFYREETGDQIAPAPRIIGSTLFFGPIGLIGALANIAVEGATGKDIGENVASWIGLTRDGEAPADQEPMVASPGFDPDDPVSVWARGEADWASQGAALSTEPKDLPQADRAPLPDAAPLLMAQDQWAQRVDRSRDVAVLGNDMRAASLAYQSVANWASTDRGPVRPSGGALTL